MGLWVHGGPLVLISTVGLMLNIYILFIMSNLDEQMQQQQYLTTTILLLIHLAAVEVAVCIVMLIFAMGLLPAAGIWCILYGFFFTLLHPVALWTVAGLNCDKYYAITASLRYTEMVSPRRVTLGLAITWVIALLLCLLPFSGIVPPYCYVPGLDCCAPDFGNVAWGLAGALYGAAYALFSFVLPSLLIILCNLRVLRIVRYHRHCIATAICEVTLSAQMVTSKTNQIFVHSVTSPSYRAQPKFHRAHSKVTQLVGSVCLLYYPYCGLILWESFSSSLNLSSNNGGTLWTNTCGIGDVSLINTDSELSSTHYQQPTLVVHPHFVSFASFLLACSPAINALLYSLNSYSARRFFSNYRRKVVTRREVQLEIHARNPSMVGSRRASSLQMYYPFPPLTRRFSEAVLTLNNHRPNGSLCRTRLQPSTMCEIAYSMPGDAADELSMPVLLPVLRTDPVEIVCQQLEPTEQRWRGTVDKNGKMPDCIE